MKQVLPLIRIQLLEFLPFKALKVDALRLYADGISFVDAKDTIQAAVGTMELRAKAESWDDMQLTLDAQNVSAALKGETYADNLHLELIAPLAIGILEHRTGKHDGQILVGHCDIAETGRTDR